PQCCRREIP
ncbi:hypothetical protein BN1723_019289, partial [Verticillium longisporum]